MHTNMLSYKMTWVWFSALITISILIDILGRTMQKRDSFDGVLIVL